MSSPPASSAPTSPSDANHSLPATRYSLLPIAYFRSGWAFLLPYLAAYLLYAWLHWPVNPAVAGADSEGQRAWSLVPCLLHVYWALHAVHLALGAIALRSWWRSESAGQSATCEVPCIQPASNLALLAAASSTPAAPALSSSPSALSSSPTADRLLSTGYSLLPWLCLALIFWIPGLYLEWPSDPWEHLRRINEWRILDEVTAHFAWKKSSYFLPYSLTYASTAASQFGMLNLHCTAVSILLSWHYYRLSRAVGLSSMLAMLVSLITPLVFGNSGFSYWRYYGLSSSIYGQIAIIAALRWAIETEWSVTRAKAGAFLSHVTSSIATMVALLALAAWNHPQALLTTVLGLIVIWSWRWSRANPVRPIILVVGLITASAFVTFALPRNPQWTDLVANAGWTLPGGGFALIDPRSPAFERAILILGGLGAFNVVSAFWLMRENHPAAWLTLGPLLLLMCPVVAIPLLNALITEHQPVLVFHRVLFGIPPVLVIVIVLHRIWNKLHLQFPATNFLCLNVILLALLIIPVSRPGFNRVYNLWAHQSEPGLLSLANARELSQLGSRFVAEVTGLPSVVFALRAMIPDSGPSSERELWGRPPAQNAAAAMNQLAFSSEPKLLLALDPKHLTQPRSAMGFATGHWSPTYLAMNLAGQSELLSHAATTGAPAVDAGGLWVRYLTASRPFLEAFHQVTISPGISGPISFNPLGHGEFFELEGTVLRGSATAAGFKPAILAYSNEKPYSVLRDTRRDGVLRLTASSDFSFDLKRLSVREPAGISSLASFDEAAEPLELLANLKIQSRASPGGLFVHIILNPACAYHFELQGISANPAASLRLRASGRAGEHLKYLSLAAEKTQFTVDGLGAIELLIFQDIPFEYLLCSLKIVKREQVSGSPMDTFSLPTRLSPPIQ